MGVIEITSEGQDSPVFIKGIIKEDLRTDRRQQFEWSDIKSPPPSVEREKILVLIATSRGLKVVLREDRRC